MRNWEMTKKECAWLRSLEYENYSGKYSIRVTCEDCAHFRRVLASDGHETGTCDLLDESIRLNHSNNVCRRFKPRIKNPSAPAFDYDEYFEFLMNDYYRPMQLDLGTVEGSVPLDPSDEYVEDGGRLARTYPNHYAPYYPRHDMPFCRIDAVPDAQVSVGRYRFHIDYWLYRDQTWAASGKIRYKQMSWRRSPRSKLQRQYNGEFDLSKTTREGFANDLD
jgi:hypothetical protein